MRSVTGEQVGTRFPSNRTRMESRKRWILAGLAGKAAAHIDAGAVTALGRGRSLLPAGVVTVKGPFDRGDSVNIVGPEGKAGRVRRRQLQRGGSRAHQRMPIGADYDRFSGINFGDEVIHRNNVVML